MTNNKGNTKAAYYWPFVRGIHWFLVDSPHETPVTWKTFPCHDVIVPHLPSKSTFRIICFTCDVVVSIFSDFMTSKSSLLVMAPSPSLSNMANAIRKSGKRKKNPGQYPVNQLQWISRSIPTDKYDHSDIHVFQRASIIWLTCQQNGRHFFSDKYIQLKKLKSRLQKLFILFISACWTIAKEQSESKYNNLHSRKFI